MTQLANVKLKRRPIKLRDAAWSLKLAAFLVRIGCTPNLVSVTSVACAILGAVLYYFSLSTVGVVSVPFLLTFAALIQARLVCNMVDGLMAVECKRKSLHGELFNEIPDRISDTVFLVSTGYATGNELGIALGWTSAILAVLTAYLRALGASLTGSHDFRGPMAKQQRMFVLTLGTLCSTVEVAYFGSSRALLFALAVIGLGTIVTCVRRIKYLASAMES